MKAGWLYVVLIGAVTLAIASAMVNADRRDAETDLAAPGSPLYDRAVVESISGLAGKGQNDPARGPSPGPGYYWCEHCKTYHRRQDQQAQAGEYAVGGAPAGRPPSPGPDHYWCEKCKAYHQRSSDGGTPAPSPAAPEADAGVRPPSPGPDYYWCRTCKAYHRQPGTGDGAADVPSHGHAEPPTNDNSFVGRALDGAYYYCAKCQTYHRRGGEP
jgi:hypothetical protein